LEPLRGKASTLVVNGRSENLSLAAFLCSCFSVAHESCTVFDTDALYASNAPLILDGLEKTETSVFIPRLGRGIRHSILDFLQVTDLSTILFDNLNSLLRLFSAEDRNGANRQFAFTMAILSHIAKTNGLAVMATAYRQSKRDKTTIRAPFYELADLTMNVEVKAGQIEFRCTKTSLWQDGHYVWTNPSDQKRISPARPTGRSAAGQERDTG